MGVIVVLDLGLPILDESAPLSHRGHREIRNYINHGGHGFHGWRNPSVSSVKSVVYTALASII
jgi:hypothetical protein